MNNASSEEGINRDTSTVSTVTSQSLAQVSTSQQVLKLLGVYGLAAACSKAANYHQLMEVEAGSAKGSILCTGHNEPVSSTRVQHMVCCVQEHLQRGWEGTLMRNLVVKVLQYMQLTMACVQWVAHRAQHSTNHVGAVRLSKIQTPATTPHCYTQS